MVYFICTEDLEWSDSGRCEVKSKWKPLIPLTLSLHGIWGENETAVLFHIIPNT